MFADPISITINAIAKSLARTGTGVDAGAFSDVTRAFRLAIAHSYGRVTSRVIKLTVDSLVANPLVSGQQIPQTMSVHLVIKTPPGYDTTTAKQNVDGFVAYLAASSGAAVTKLLAGES